MLRQGASKRQKQGLAQAASPQQPNPSARVDPNSVDLAERPDPAASSPAAAAFGPHANAVSHGFPDLSPLGPSPKAISPMASSQSPRAATHSPRAGSLSPKASTHGTRAARRRAPGQADAQHPGAVASRPEAAVVDSKALVIRPGEAASRSRAAGLGAVGPMVLSPMERDANAGAMVLSPRVIEANAGPAALSPRVVAANAGAVVPSSGADALALALVPSPETNAIEPYEGSNSAIAAMMRHKIIDTDTHKVRSYTRL